MTMTPVIAGMRIADDLHLFEASLAETLALAGKLGATMTGARTELQVAPAIGHRTMLRFARIQTALLTINGDTARMHENLRTDAAEVGIGYGDTFTTAILRRLKARAA